MDTIFNLNEFQSAMIFYVTSIYMIKCPKIVGALPSELKLHRNFLGGKSISAAATTWNLDESSNDLYSFEYVCAGRKEQVYVLMYKAKWKGEALL